MVKIHKPLWLGAVVFLGGASLLAGGKFPYMFFYMSVFIFLLPYLGLQKNLHRLTGDVEISSPYGEVGQKLSVTYKLTNPPAGKFPYLELTGMMGASLQAEDEGKIISLEGGETAVFHREILCARRGIYDMASLKVRTGDPFGLFTLERSLTAGKQLKVYPTLKNYPQVILLARQHFGNLKVKDKQFEDYSQVSDLRVWQDGDSIKRIHWRMSARHDAVVVKNFALKADTSLTIFVNMGANNYRHDLSHRLEDLAVEAAASFIYHSLRENLPLRVFSEPALRDGLPGRNFRDYRQIMDRIITLSPVGKEGFSTFVHNQSYYLAPKSSLYLITPALNFPDAAVFLGLKQRGFHQVLFYLTLEGPKPGEAALLDKVKEAGINVHVLHAPGGD